ncbi:MAG: ABC transporter ATP-binding protein [Myxococcota bacterium]|nr:ABC transporter ATP-binding protein [Myxococcota bacterium]
MIVARKLTQRYPRANGGPPLTVLDRVEFSVDAGEVVAILGPSGSGKTTLLGLLAGLDRPSEGTVELEGRDLGPLDEDARAQLRAASIGFVFQNFQLLPTLTALENVLVPLELLPRDRARTPAEDERRAHDLLARVGLEERTGHYPSQLSGGEQQRVAIARAFANEPRVLFADEPTGNLDRGTGHEVAELLFGLNRERGTTLVIVTHDTEIAARAQRIVRLDAGRVVS